MSKYIVGYDIGGTKCSVILSNNSNGIHIIDKFRYETPSSYPETKALLFKFTYELLDKYSLPVSAVTAFGISCGGPLDAQAGIIYSPPNLPSWDAVPICDEVTKEFGVRAYLQNDANASALVEWRLGAGKGVNNMLFLTMGTGFGAGIIAEGVLLNGANGLAGEVGHIRLKSDGPLGYGKAGSIEGFCSGAGISAQAIEFTRMKQAQGITPAWIADGVSLCDISAKLIGDYAEAGDPLAREIYEIIGENLGRALSIFIDIFNPEKIVIGSIFARRENLLREPMQREIFEEALELSHKNCEILPAATGEDLGDLASIMTACYYTGIEYAPLSPPTKPEVLFHYEKLFTRYPSLSALKENIMHAYMLIDNAYKKGGKLLICGNGGSAADADHIVGELMKGFYKRRELNAKEKERLGKIGEQLQGALPAIALSQHTALSTAFANDVDSSLVYAQQVFGYGHKNDVLLAISTSGNSINITNAVETANAMGITTIGLTGESGGKLMSLCDVCLNVAGSVTADIQELHLPIYHTLCAMLEEEFF